MPQDPPAIQQFLKNSGRLDFKALESFAENHDEEAFVRFLKTPVFMGNEVLEGELSHRRGDTTVFISDHVNISKRQVLMRPPMMHLVYPFIKRLPTGNPDFFSIGRNEENDFVLPDYTISNIQAGIRRTGANRYLLRSAPATNPTRLNGRTIEKSEAFLHDEDRITLGRYEFLFLSPSALYCRFKGVELKLRIQQFLDSLGKADHDFLKDYAIRHGQEMFEQLMMSPSLVGSGLFRGYSLDRDTHDGNTTLAFLPDITFGMEPKHFKMLERAIYPLVEPETAWEDHPIIRIGRSETNDVIMQEGSISNNHATIDLLGPGHYHMNDLGSTNGSFINDKPVFPPLGQDLHDGDRIKLGRFEFTFLYPGSLYMRMTPENVRRRR
ncbi:MAG: FHA domain-containing protein [Nitrospirae bacterium]|nr:FHA domain-containing protein [Magnetococcales bacterium]